VSNDPRLLLLVGPDGCGKSTLARMVVESLERRGFKTLGVWSRYNNYLSKPLLALARLTGHSYRERRDGFTFGYHEFSRCGVYRTLFPILQACDANLAARSSVRSLRESADVLVFERGPWDTLVDVMLDTGRADLARGFLGRWMTAPVRRGSVVAIRRDYGSILQSRPELRHDRTLVRKMQLYRDLASALGWTTLDNNHSVEAAAAELLAWVETRVPSRG
jgi:hypothetical protein